MLSFSAQRNQPRGVTLPENKPVALEKADFEKRFLNLIYQSDVVITPPNVAYHLQIPIEEAQDQLIALELNGTLQQATDPQGNTYYMMPNRPPPGTFPAGTAPSTENRGNNPGVYNPAALPAIPMHNNPGAKGMNINGLVLNVVAPGVGSLVCGKMIGLAMLGLVILGIVLVFLPLGFGRAIGLLPIVAGWIWSIVAGVQLLNQKEPGPGIPT
jgi:hypothetical protein